MRVPADNGASWQHVSHPTVTTSPWRLFYRASVLRAPLSRLLINLILAIASYPTTFRYPNLTSMDRVEWLGILNALVDMPDLTSPACLRKAIQVLQGMVSIEPAFIGKYELHSTFFTSMAYAYGAATCPRAPVWRGLAVSRRAEFHYQVRLKAALIKRISMAVGKPHLTRLYPT